MDEFDVAVVVFVRAQGVDERDAENRAAGTVSQVLRNEGVLVHAANYPSRSTVQAVDVLPLSTASGSGYLRTAPGPLAYKQRGLGAPRQAVEN